MTTASLAWLTKIVFTDLAQLRKLNPFWVSLHFGKDFWNTGHYFLVSVLISIYQNDCLRKADVSLVPKFQLRDALSQSPIHNPVFLNPLDRIDVLGQQAVLKALAPHPSGLNLKTLADATDLSEETLGEALKMLARHDVVQETEGDWSIIVELFRRWVLEQA